MTPSQTARTDHFFAYRVITLFAIFSSLVLISLGGFVHNTGASLACPDWPLCYGQVMPRMEGGVLIEHSHRLLASFVGFLVLIMCGIAFRRRIENPKHLKLALLALGLVCFQGLLGGLTVIYRLPTIVSTAHLGTSLVFLVHLLRCWIEARPDSNISNLRLLAPALRSAVSICTLLLVFTFGQVLLGGFIRHSGLGGACGLGAENAFLCFDVVNMSKTLIPQSFPAALHFAHRVFGVLIALSSLWGVRKIFQMNAGGLVRNSLIGICLVVLAQVALGFLSVATDIGVAATTLHLTGASLLVLLWAYCAMSLSSQLAGESVFSVASDALSMTKPRLAGLVLFTTAIGIYLAQGNVLDATSLITICSTAMVVAGACVLNCVMESDLDAKMERTKDRPLAAKRMVGAPFYQLGWLVNIVGTLGLVFFAPSVTVWLGILATLLYLYFYTPLKRVSPLAVFAGAIPGAIPPLMGQTSVTGQVSVEGILVFGVLFIWQLPHFLSISMFRANDYDNAGIKVVPTVFGNQVARVRIFVYTLGLVAISVLPVLFWKNSTGHLISVCIVGGLFTLHAARGLGHRLTEEGQIVWARQYFWGSLIYLPCILTSLMVFQPI